jgi:alpha-tubulin suppressor-like RCC1 family protein
VKSISWGWTTVCLAVSGGNECFVFSEKELTTTKISLSESAIKSNTRITDIKTNDVTVFVTTSDRRLLSVDLRHAADTSNLLLQPLLPEFCIRTVSCGKHHVLVLSMIGVVFSCGNGGQGQLGHGSVEHKLTPAVVEALEGVTVTNIAAGGWHSLAVTDAGDLYAWGWNERGQLGLPSVNVSGKGKKGKESSITDVELQDGDHMCQREVKVSI